MKHNKRLSVIYCTGAGIDLDNNSSSSLLIMITRTETTKTPSATTNQSMAPKRGWCWISYDKALDFASKQKASRISTKCYRYGIYVYWA